MKTEIVQLKRGKDRDPRPLNQNKTLHPHRLRSHLWASDNDFLIHMTQACIHQQHNRMEDVRKKNRKFSISLRSFKESKSLTRKSWCVTWSNYRKRAFSPIKQFRLLLRRKASWLLALLKEKARGLQAWLGRLGVQAKT